MSELARTTTHAELIRQAETLYVAVLVYVPAPERPRLASRRPAVRIIDGVTAADAESAGREWFKTARTQPQQDRWGLDGRVLVPLRNRDADVLGIVVATPQPPLHWTGEQRSELRRVVESHAGEIEPGAENGAPRLPPVDRLSVAAVDPDDFATDLRNAVRLDELHLEYQPEVDLPTGKIVAVEALVRWTHPRLGELGPEWFISLAERSDLIVLVGDWVLTHSMMALAAWNAALPGLDLLLRVNVSPVQLDGERVVTSVAAALDRFGIPGRQLCIELTENAQLSDVEEVARSIALLKDLGVSAAIDDLATGYSALSRLRSLPVDDVKIDRSLISGIDTDPRAQAITVALIGLALNIGVGIIAEGVETAAEAQTLLDLGCVRAQGHHLGRPMDGDALLRLLTDRNARGDDTH